MDLSDCKIAFILVEVNQLSYLWKLVNALGDLLTFKLQLLLVKQWVVDGKLLTIAVEALTGRF